MSKTLYLHIGHYKTGTTAIQVFCARNRKLLAKQGVDYADVLTHNAKHSSLAFSIYQEAGVSDLMHGYSNTATPDALWAEMFEYAQNSKADKILVSSEELARVGEFPAASEILKRVAALRPDINVRVILYLRDPQAHLRSWYNQLIKMGCVVPDYNSAITGQIESIHTDYRKVLIPWVDAFGPESIILRQYEGKSSDPTALFQDFLSIFELPLTDRFDVPSEDPNPRLDDRAIELVRLAQNIGLPRKSVEAIQNKSAAFLREQDTTRPEDHLDFETVRANAHAGLAALENAPNSNLDIAALQQNLPVPIGDSELNQAHMTGFVLSELISLRQRVNRIVPDLTKKIKALENRLDALQTPRQDENE